MAIADERVSIERHGVVIASRRCDAPRGSSHVPTELALDLLSRLANAPTSGSSRTLRAELARPLRLSDETECDHARIEMAGRFDTLRGMLRVGFRNTLDPRFECRVLNMVTGLLGSTGLVVSRIGFGLAALGRPAYINLGRERDLGANRTVADLERRCHELLDAAYAAGIRYVDAARSYGMAEAFLASWLKTRCRSRDDLTIGSKWGYTYVGSWRLDSPVHEVKDLSVQALRRQIAESRTLLGDRLRLYQIHSATLDSRRPRRRRGPSRAPATAMRRTCCRFKR